jgi:hypothetical protein
VAALPHAFECRVTLLFFSDHGDWSLWMNNSDKDALKPDFLHEALKRILLRAIMWIQEEREEHWKNTLTFN